MRRGPPRRFGNSGDCASKWARSGGEKTRFKSGHCGPKSQKMAVYIVFIVSEDVHALSRMPAEKRRLALGGERHRMREETNSLRRQKGSSFGTTLTFGQWRRVWIYDGTGATALKREARQFAVNFDLRSVIRLARCISGNFLLQFFDFKVVAVRLYVHDLVFNRDIRLGSTTMKEPMAQEMGAWSDREAKVNLSCRPR